MKIPARLDVAPDAVRHFTADMTEVIGRVNVAEDPYLPWERFRFHTPPAGLTPQQWWEVTVVLRQLQWRALPLLDGAGRPFHYALPDEVLRLVSEVAVKAGGNIGMPEPVTDAATRDTYIVRSLMEESITSSQLEGAATTRRVAKQMLRSGRQPRDKSERMIWNNYQAMTFMVAHRAAPLTPEFVLELHAILTDRTLDDPADGGRLQTPAEQRVHVGTFDGEVLHEPPPAEELPERLSRLCAFANSTEESGPWLHPILRALTVHFMVGHDHFFVDGNGRLARALFYWSMLHQGLWLTEFITISTILKNAPTQYAHSYLNSEYQSDLTYFYVHHLHVLNRAFDDLEEYLARKIQQRQEVTSLIQRRHADFNHRQLDIIDRALGDATAEFTVVSHARSHAVTPETARQDLLSLTDSGILERFRRGHAYVWRAAPDARAHL